MITYTITKSDLQARAKNFGYCVRILDHEIEAYPRGMRGDASYFATDDQDGRIEVINFMRADRDARFLAKLERLPISDETKEALVKWHAYHGTEWREALYSAWFNGAYNGFGNDWNVTGTLQRFRNTNGHEVVSRIR